MSQPIVNAVPGSTPGTYRIIDRHLNREATVSSSSAASAITRYLGICQIDHPAVDARIESMQAGNYAMTV
jgi:hypothetical protein